MASNIEIQIPKLKSSLLEIIKKVEDIVQKSIKSFEERNYLLAKTIIDDDKIIDKMEIDLEEECLKVMALNHPVAVDLRLIVSIIKITNTLEEIADISKNISLNVLELCDLPNPGSVCEFSKLSNHVLWMLKNAMDSMLELNSALAREVCIKEDELDEEYLIVKKQILTAIEKERKNFSVYINNLSVADNLEKIGDELKKIAQDVIYTVDAEVVRHKEF